jgi:hypothetical protein
MKGFEKVNLFNVHTAPSITQIGPMAAVRGHRHILNREMTNNAPRFNFLTKNRLKRKWNALHIMDCEFKNAATV